MKDPLKSYYKVATADTGKSAYNPLGFVGVAIVWVPALVFGSFYLLVNIIAPSSKFADWVDRHIGIALFGSVFCLMVYFFCRWVFDTKTGDGVTSGAERHG